ncbi:MAG: hypothetical protein KBT39_11545 [Bacteroidales bacterium]|nr:hypothetical protein [Bacteroidales bacterium]
MKKYISIFSLAILALLAVGFSSCGDDEVVPAPAPVQKHYISYKLALSDAFFEFADFTINVDSVGVKKSYPIVASLHSDSIGTYYDEDKDEDVTVGGRSLQIPAIEYENEQPIHVSVSYKLTEAGKALIANASEEDSKLFRFYLKAGDCTKSGMFSGTAFGWNQGGYNSVKLFEGHVNAVISVCSVDFPLDEEKYK